MKLFFRVLIAFLAITGAVALAMNYSMLEFGHSNYWNHHGIWILIFLAAFPRLTLFIGWLDGGLNFAGTIFAGWIGGLSWFFVPRIMIAVVATLNYWRANPILVIAAWLIAVGGESGEKVAIRYRGKSKNKKRT